MMENRGEIPEDLQVFGERLTNLNLESTEGFFKGTVTGTDGSIALIFASETMLRALQNATTFSMDSISDVNIIYINFAKNLTMIGIV